MPTPNNLHAVAPVSGGLIVAGSAQSEANWRTSGGSVNPDAEDLKIITLARSTRAHTGAPEGAAVRDETGRTYAAAAVALPSLRLSALRLAVAMAASSGATSLEAAAVVSDTVEPNPEDVAAVRDLGPAAIIFHAAPDGTVPSALTP